MTARIVVLASGNGSNAQAIIDACAASKLDAIVVAVVSNVPEAYALTRARAVRIDAVCVAPTHGEVRTEYDRRLCAQVAKCHPDIVVLAGWMRILSSHFLDEVNVPVINLHPGLPGEFPGVDSIRRAFDERSSGRVESGIMVHLVPDEGVDSGPVLGVRLVPIFAHDALADFEERMHAAEHELLVEVLAEFLTRSNVGREK